MKTVLYNASYLVGKDNQGNDRLERTVRYLNYYLSQKEAFGIQDAKLADNGSPQELYKVLGERLNGHHFTIRFGAHLEHNRPGKQYDYPNLWRSFYAIQDLIKEGYQKIIMFDSDTFVLSKRCADYVKNLNSGFTTFWCRKWGFPAAEASILCEDKFDRFLEFCKVPWEQRVGSLMEITLPFTQINIEYYCDRLGEVKAPITPEIDIYSQMGPELTPILK